MTALLKSMTTNPKPRSENPDPVDIYAGKRLYALRKIAGLTQGQLAKTLGLTFQQIQKYERGANRMGLSRLYHISKVLSVPIGYFVEGMTSETMRPPGFAENDQEPLEMSAAVSDQPDNDVMHRRETLDLIRAYYRIQDPKQRRKVYELMRTMADEE